MSFLYSLARTQVKYNTGISLAVQWLKLCTSLQGAQVGSLLRKVGSHMLGGMAKNTLQVLDSRKVPPLT